MNDMADRLITINIRKYLATQPRTKRARKAVRYVRERVAHFTKMKPENIKLGYELNNLIFKEYSRSMRPLKVRVKMGTDTADVLPFKEEVPGQPAQQAAAKEEKKPLFRIKKQEPKPAEKKESQPQPATKKEAQPKQKEQAQASKPAT
jgi:ribosomal protein L31E